MSPNAVTGVPIEQARPTRYLTLPDGETVVPLEFPCHHCGGGGTEPGRSGFACPACKGFKVELSAQGRALLAFLDKWGSRSREVVPAPRSLQDTVVKDAAQKMEGAKK